MVRPWRDFAELRQGSPNRLPGRTKGAPKLNRHASGVTDGQAMARRLRLDSGLGWQN